MNIKSVVALAPVYDDAPSDGLTIIGIAKMSDDELQGVIEAGGASREMIAYASLMLGGIEAVAVADFVTAGRCANACGFIAASLPARMVG